MAVSKQKNKLKWVLPLVIILSAAITFTVLKATKPQAKSIEVTEIPVSVLAQPIELSENTPEVRLFGTVEAVTRTTLTSSVEGDNLTVHVQDGDQVTKNQILVSIDDRSLKLSLAQREAEVRDIAAQIEVEELSNTTDLNLLKEEQMLLKLADAAVKRAKTLETNALGSQSVLDEAQQNRIRQLIAVHNREKTLDSYPARLNRLKALLAQAKARRDQAKIDLANAQIRAPYDGQIIRVKVADGGQIRRGGELLEMFDPANRRIRAQIPLPVAQTLNRKNTQHVATTWIDNKQFQFPLNAIVGESKNGTGVDGMFLINQSEFTLPVGQVVDLALHMPPVSNSMAVPTEALYGTNTGYLIREERLHSISLQRHGVRLRDDGSHQVVITSPQLKNGEQLLVSKFANASENLKVKVRTTP